MSDFKFSNKKFLFMKRTGKSFEEINNNQRKKIELLSIFRKIDKRIKKNMKKVFRSNSFSTKEKNKVKKHSHYYITSVRFRM